MKILHVITSLELGGAQRLLTDLLPIQAKTDNVSILVYSRIYNSFEQKIESAGIEIISLNESNFRNPGVILKLRNIIKHYDIVHAHLFPTLYWASIASWGLPIKLLYTEHSTSNRRRGKWYYRFIERFMYNRYNCVISISQQTHYALTSWLKTIDSKYVVVNNGVPISQFAKTTAEVNSNSLIMVSRFAESKDQETVIRALQYINPKVVIRFVGDGPKRQRCENLAKEMGVFDRTQFLGSRSDVADLIAASYIGIQSSHWEGFGLTAVEIMACGKPIIGTEVDGLKQVIDGAGLVFPVGDEKMLAKQINSLMENPTLYASVAAKCKERAQQYDITNMATNYHNIYHSL